MENCEVKDIHTFNSIREKLEIEDTSIIFNNVYHYTDKKNLFKILKDDNVKFKMTRYEDFNDKTEGRVIEVYYDLVLESLEKEGILTSEERFYLSELEVQEEVVFYKKQCDGITVNTAIGTECNYYVACFSTEKNDEYMFKNYVNTGKGVCLEFLGDIIFPCGCYNVPNGIIVKGYKVLYGREVIDFIYDKLKNLFAFYPLNEENREMIKYAIEQMLNKLTFRTKLGKFSKENEIRLIVGLPEKNFSEDNNQYSEKNYKGKRFIYYFVPKDSFCDITFNNIGRNECDKLCRDIRNKNYDINLKHQ